MKPLVILAGPTAVGKTALSIKLAKKINGAVISADSMQVYKHMDIGSAKVMPEEMKGIPHYLINVLEPSEEFNIVRFQQMAKEALIKGLDHTKRSSYFFSESRGSQAICRIFHTFLFTDNVSANRSKAASRVFNQRTDHHIRSHCKWLPVFHKLSVTIVNHTDDIRFDIFDKCDQFSNPLDRQRWTCLVSLRALDGYQAGVFMDCIPDSIVIK